MCWVCFLLRVSANLTIQLFSLPMFFSIFIISHPSWTENIQTCGCEWSVFTRVLGIQGFAMRFACESKFCESLRFVQIIGSLNANPASPRICDGKSHDANPIAGFEMWIALMQIPFRIICPFTNPIRKQDSQRDSLCESHFAYLGSIYANNRICRFVFLQILRIPGCAYANLSYMITIWKKNMKFATTICTFENSGFA